MSLPKYFEPFYAIKIGGIQLADKHLVRLSGELIVTFKAKDDDQANFAFDETLGFYYQGAFKEGMDVEIEFGHLRGARGTYTGEVSGIKATFPESGVPTITFECASKAKKGHEQQKSRTFREMKRSDIAAQLAKEHGWETNIAATTDVVRQESQSGESDVQFLKRLAKKEGYIFKVVDNVMLFGPQPIAKTAEVTLDYRMGNFLIKSFEPEYQTQDKGKKVEAHNIDEKEQQEVQAKAWGTKEKLGLEGGVELVAKIGANGAGGGAAAAWASQGSGNPAASVARRPDETSTTDRPAPPSRTGLGLLLTRLEEAGVKSSTSSLTEEGETPPAAETGMVVKETVHYLKDSEEGGALPSTQADMEKAVKSKQDENEKIVGATLDLVVCMPYLKGNSKVVVRGGGPRFSGQYFVEEAAHLVGSNGSLTRLKLSRNALGDDSSKKPSKPTEPRKRWDKAAKLGVEDVADIGDVLMQEATT